MNTFEFCSPSDIVGSIGFTGESTMLKDLYVMKVDAKQELDNLNSGEALERFKQSIFVPAGVNIDSLLDGDRYFLTGEKGAGKTALLIYAALKAEELFRAERSFILFKEFSPDEREDYTSLAHVTIYDKREIESALDYEYVWNWVFHNCIVDTILSSPREIFVADENLNTYLASVKAIPTYMRGNNRRMPVVTKDGYVEASFTVPIKGVNIGLAGRINFERNPVEQEKIRFSTHIHEINHIFVNLKAGDSQLYIIVDEMNLSTVNPAENTRDIFMIRDLIIAIENFNAMSKNSHANIRVIGGIRNEVINSVKTKGKEINKAIESYGIPIDWTQYTENRLDHPLLRLLINIFRISLKQMGKDVNCTESEIYQIWVDDVIFNANSDDIIRNYTLYRPRHVIRLLNLFKLLCGNDARITTHSFQAIKRKYSFECWNEITEEMSLKYSTDELTLIKEWLTGMPWYSSCAKMTEKAAKHWIQSDIGKNLFERLGEVYRDLYKAGVLGNILRQYNPPKQRWYFKGDETLFTDQGIQIHRIFQNVLSTVDPNKVID